MLIWRSAEPWLPLMKEKTVSLTDSRHLTQNPNLYKIGNETDLYRNRDSTRTQN